MTPFEDLKPMTDDVIPITVEERQARIDKARRLMIEQGIDALFLEAGPGLRYFTGVEWWRDERLLAAVIPARGEIAYVCPAFECDRLLEMVTIGEDVRPWEEDESPYARVAGILRDRGLSTGRLGIEESVRYFIYNGVRKRPPKSSASARTRSPSPAACTSPRPRSR